MNNTPLADDFELSNDQLSQVHAAASNNALVDNNRSRKLSSNHKKYLKALKKRAKGLYSLVLLSLTSIHGTKKVSNNKF